MRWLNDYSKHFLSEGYLLPGQTPDQRIDIICNRAEELLKIPGFAAKFRANVEKGWYSFSSPIWSNFGTDRGLPISCFGSHIDDTMESILYTHAEIGMMSKYGGGTSAYMGAIRGRGAPITDNGQSSGSVHMLGMFDKLLGTVSQGSTRRGSFAAYTDLDHPDILEFLTIKSESSTIQDISFGAGVPGGWMQSMIDGDRNKRMIWAEVLKSRSKTGFPYILFKDNAQAGAPTVYRNCPINQSNLCTEIMLPNTVDESFVCDLSSMNIRYYDEWLGTDAVQMLVFFLDVVMTEFIEKVMNIKFMERAAKFAIRHRALGVGWLGWHSYLQEHMIPFESMQAKYKNIEIAKYIHNEAYKGSMALAQIFGEPEMLIGHGRRNTTLLAIAPTKSSSIILGQASEGIEPNQNNYFIKDTAKGKFSIRNQALKALLREKGEHTQGVWESILANKGSVSHLNFLNEHEKAVFKTFIEISPRETVIQASGRQKWIDQGQSLNLLIDPRVPIKQVNALMIEAWQLGLKSLYYHKSENAAQELARDILSCASCEG